MFILPSHPTKARFLNDEQKYIALERIRLNNTGTQNTEFKWSQVKECLLDPKQWAFALMVFCVSLVSGGISAFGREYWSTLIPPWPTADCCSFQLSSLLDSGLISSKPSSTT